MKKRNRNLVKRALSVCLSLSMCLGMLQITAFAVEGETTPETVETEFTDSIGQTVTVPVEATDDNGGYHGELDVVKENTVGESVTVTVDREVKEEAPAQEETVHEKEEGEWSEPVVEYEGEGENRRPVHETSGKTDKQETEVVDEKVTTVTDTNTKVDVGVCDPSKVELVGDAENVTVTVPDKTVSEESTSVDLLKPAGATSDVRYQNGRAEKTEHQEYDATTGDILANLFDQVTSDGDYTSKEGKWTKTDTADGKQRVTTVEPVLDSEGKTIGYKKTVEIYTITGTKEVLEIISDETENKQPTVVIPSHEISKQEGEETTVDGFEATSAPEQIIAGDIPEGATPIEENGVVIGYEVSVVNPIDPEDETAGTKTTVEKVYFQTSTETVTNKTQEVDSVTTETVTKVEGTLTDKRVSTVLVDTTTETHVVDPQSTQLKVTLDPGTGELEDNSKFSNDTYSDSDFDDAITVNCFEGASVTVRQESTDETKIEASLKFDFKLTESQLDNSNLVLTIASYDENGNFVETKSYSLAKDSEDVVINKTSGVQSVTVNGISAGRFSLSLTGKQNLGEGKVGKEIEIKTEIKVSINKIAFY